MTTPPSKYELIFSACISGAVIGCIISCFILLLAKVDYQNNSDTLITWILTCMLVSALVGVKVGYQFFKKSQSSNLLKASNSKPNKNVMN